jgi:hypothetical protein
MLGMLVIDTLVAIDNVIANADVKLATRGLSSLK